uniref:AN1-type domain-containing protein n=1 Tax=viral metagenome TaxID=1070528 RepID=A0A6C0KI26_9ZZZZ
MSLKCNCCRKKVGLVSFDCRCGLKILCLVCRNPDVHKCSVNYQDIHKDEIRKNNPLVIGDKIEKI